MSDMELAKRITECREAKGLTKSDLARRTSVTTTAVWNWETNGRRPHDETLKLIASALGTSASYLLTGEHPLRPTTMLSAKPSPHTVQDVLDYAQAEIARIVGLGSDKVKIRVEIG